jgi:hypothetical protein
MGSVTKFQDQNKTIFLLCDCKSEVLVIDYDSDYQLADFSIYENFASYSNKMSLWQKIRYMYKVMVTGNPYADQMVFNREQLKEIKDFLNQII